MTPLLGALFVQGTALPILKKKKEAEIELFDLFLASLQPGREHTHFPEKN